MKHCHKMSGLGLLILRLGLGAIFLAHGGQKVFGWFGGSGLEATVQGFTNMGGQPWMGYAVAFGELLGGLGLIVGCLTRLAGLGLAVIMGGAIQMVHLKNGFFMNHFMVPDKGHGIEFALALFCMSLALAFTGPGFLSLDRCLFGGKCKHSKSESEEEE